MNCVRCFLGNGGVEGSLDFVPLIEAVLMVLDRSSLAQYSGSAFDPKALKCVDL